MTLVLAVEPSGLPSASGFLLIGIGAFTLPIIARRLRMPAVVLEIVYGLVLGPEVLNIFRVGTRDFAFIEVLAGLGLLLLMFLAGFEVDFERLERQGRGPITTGLILYAVVIAAIWFGFGIVGTDSMSQRVFLTLLTSAASLGIVIPALRSTGVTGSRLGQLTIVAAVLAEFLSAAAIVVFGVWHESGVSWRLLGVPALFVIMAVLLVAIRRLAWWYPERFEGLFAAHDPDEMGIRASLAMMFVFVGISLLLNVEGILGAFLAGALFAYVFRDTGQLEARLTGFAYGFFVPVFFIGVGARFPLGELGDRSVLRRALGLIAVAVAAKLIASLLLIVRGLSLRQALASGVLLAGQLSVIIALAELGVDLDVIDEGLEAGAILLVGVTALLSPIVFRLLLPPRKPSPEQVGEFRDR